MSSVSDDVSWWFCCLNPAERSVMRSTAEGLALTLYTGIPAPLWDAFWVVTLHDAVVYKDTFKALYHLRTDTVVIDDVDTPVVVQTDGSEAWWAAVLVFMLTPGGACLSGCEQTQLP